MMKNETINNEVVILYREDIFSAWTNIKPNCYEELAYFLKVKGEIEDLYFMIGKPENSFFVDIK
jgi:hypothetical protein